MSTLQSEKALSSYKNTPHHAIAVLSCGFRIEILTFLFFISVYQRSLAVQSSLTYIFRN